MGVSFLLFLKKNKYIIKKYHKLGRKLTKVGTAFEYIQTNHNVIGEKNR